MDTKKDNLLNQQQESLPSSSSSLIFKPLIKKTEKIIAALYLVTSLFEEGESIRIKLRNASVEILGSIHNLSIAEPLSKHVLFESIRSRIEESTSYIEVARMTGSVSEMNANILVKELDGLKAEISRYAEENRAGKYSTEKFLPTRVGDLDLGEDFFEKEEQVESEQPKFSIEQKTQEIKGHFFKGHLKDLNNVLYNKDSILLNHFKGQDNNNAIQSDKGQTHKNDVVNKINRRNNILRLIRDKKEVTIKDISVIIVDCSEKTIQRELNTMVFEGVLKRVGKKRWSKYSLNNV